MIKLNEWGLALSDILCGESFFKLKLMLLKGAAFNELLACQVSFIDERQALAAIEYALYRKNQKG